MTQFITNFSTVFIQVIILFIFIGCGFIGGKKKFISAEGSKVMSNILLYFVTPCLIITSLNIEFDKQKFIDLIVCFGAFTAVQVVTILLVTLIFKGKERKTTTVLRLAVIFSNVGYMGLPLQSAVLGEEGLFYGSICVASFNLVVWTYGIAYSSGDKKVLSLKGIVFNPGIIAVTVGILFFLFSVKLPTPIKTAMEGMAGMNTPLAMLIIGYNLAASNILKALKDKKVYLVSFLRLIAVPLVSLAVFYL